MAQFRITSVDPPAQAVASETHHDKAARLNAAVADDASAELAAVLDGSSLRKRLLLKAAAGAGKSYALKRLVVEAVAHSQCERVAIAAFTNKQLRPLAISLGRALGKESVCLLASKAAWPDIPQEVHDNATVVMKASNLPHDAKVVIGTVHRLGAPGEYQRMDAHFGPGMNGMAPFDVLFVDEAWQVAHHLFDKITRIAPVWVGVGDVGQLPPLEVGENPWRGDPGYNPYRAWPTDYDDDPLTWAQELPAVWRPAAGQLGLWRAFYPEWASLDCVAAPGDRWVEPGAMTGWAVEVWGHVGSGTPTLVQVDGLPDPEAADIDLPLVGVIEELLGEFFAAGASLASAACDDEGRPTGNVITSAPGGDHEDPLVAVLATRNQLVDDATDAVLRLHDSHHLTDADVVASTVDSWQGQTNGVTVAVHPLNGAAELDSFNSAFGRLAVACTRATHGLLMLARPGLDKLLEEAPARPGTPFGEPGNRRLPRQTHQRILQTFTRVRVEIRP